MDLQGRSDDIARYYYSGNYHGKSIEVFFISDLRRVIGAELIPCHVMNGYQISMHSKNILKKILPIKIAYIGYDHGGNNSASNHALEFNMCSQTAAIPIGLFYPYRGTLSDEDISTIK